MTERPSHAQQCCVQMCVLATKGRHSYAVMLCHRNSNMLTLFLSLSLSLCIYLSLSVYLVDLTTAPQVPVPSPSPVCAPLPLLSHTHPHMNIVTTQCIHLHMPATAFTRLASPRTEHIKVWPTALDVGCTI